MSRIFKIFFLFIFFSLQSYSQISKVHYIPPLTNNKGVAFGSSIPIDQYLYLSTPSTENVIVTITPLNGDAPTTYNDLSNGNPIRYIQNLNLIFAILLKFSYFLCLNK